MKKKFTDGQKIWIVGPYNEPARGRFSQYKPGGKYAVLFYGIGLYWWVEFSDRIFSSRAACMAYIKNRAAQAKKGGGK